MINDGIEVYVRRVSKGTRYLEYEHEKPKYHSHTSVAYIRATTGEQFEVRVNIQQVFRYYTCSGLQIRVCIDANEAPDVYWFPKTKHPPAEGVEYVFSDFHVEIAGEWQSGKLAFGEIGNGVGETTVQFGGGSVFGNPTDPVPLNNFVPNLTPYDGPEFVAARRRRLGTIRVSVQRGNLDGKAVDPHSGTPINTTAIEADKSSGISHQVTTLHRQRVKTPELDTTTNFKPVLGTHGERYEFEFRYRSLPELIRLGLCDENGRLVEPQPEPEPEPEPKPVLEDDYSDYDDDEEDGPPIPPNHRRLSQPESHPPKSSGQRTSSRLRAIAEAQNCAALAPPKAPAQKPVNKRNESTVVKQEKRADSAEMPIPSADTPIHSIETPFPGTETHISRLTAVQHLPGPGDSSVMMRPVKRRQGFSTMSPAPGKKSRLGEEEMPAAADPPAAGPPSVSTTRPVPVKTNMPLVKPGTNIGTFMAKKPKQEPGSVSSPALSTAGPHVSTARSVSGRQGVSTRQDVSGPKPARTTTNAPGARAAQSGHKSLESVDLEMSAIEIRNQLNALDKKRMLLDNEREKLQLDLERIRAQQERQRILDSRSAADPGRKQQQQQRK
ncbi:hypothetical protein IWZ00DRAFT_553640 [Phyllosticta capitalensis]